jgi:DNA-binding MarR family transcriptional regulator
MADELWNSKPLFTMTKVAEDLGVTKGAVTRLAKEGRIAVYENPTDRRQKLVDEEQVKAAITPRLIKTYATRQAMD